MYTKVETSERTIEQEFDIESSSTLFFTGLRKYECMCGNTFTAANSHCFHIFLNNHSINFSETIEKCTVKYETLVWVTSNEWSARLWHQDNSRDQTRMGFLPYQIFDKGYRILCCSPDCEAVLFALKECKKTYKLKKNAKMTKAKKWLKDIQDPFKGEMTDVKCEDCNEILYYVKTTHGFSNWAYEPESSHWFSNDSKDRPKLKTIDQKKICESCKRQFLQQ